MWLKLALALEAGGSEMEAENVYLHLSGHSRPEVAAEAELRLARLSQLLGLPEDAAHYCRGLTLHHGGTKLADGRSATAAAAELLSKLKLPAVPERREEPPRLKVIEAKVNKKAQQISRNQIMITGSDLPYYQQAYATYDHREKSLRFTHRGKEWKFPLAPYTHRHTPGKVMFQGYHGNYVHPVGHSFYLAYRGSLVAAWPVKQELKWTLKPQEDWRKGSAPVLPLMQVVRANAIPGGGVRVYSHHPNYQTTRMATLVSASPRSLLLFDTNELLAIDPITRDIIWQRTLNAPGNSELYVVGSLIYEFRQKESLRIFRLLDGKRIKEKSLPEFFRQPGFFIRGDYLGVEEKEKEKKVVLKRVDPVSEKERWSVTTSSKACFYRPSTDEMGIIEPEGKLTFVSLETGKRTFEAKLPSVGGTPSYVQGWCDSARAYLIIPKAGNAGNMRALQLIQRAVYYHPVTRFGINGSLYCFDRQESKLLWHEKFESNNMQMIVNRSGNHDSRVLVLTQPQRKEVNVKGRKTFQMKGFKLVILDTLTGETIYEKIEESLGHYVYQMEETQDRLKLISNAGTMEIRLGPAGKDEKKAPAKPKAEPEPGAKPGAKPTQKKSPVKQAAPAAAAAAEKGPPAKPKVEPKPAAKENTENQAGPAAAKEKKPPAKPKAQPMAAPPPPPGPPPAP